MTTVGRWMSPTEYATMQETGAMIEGAGGQTFVSVGGSGSFNAAAKGSVYAEFKLPANSLLQGGQPNWYKVIGPNAGNAMQNALKKQGGGCEANSLSVQKRSNDSFAGIYLHKWSEGTNRKLEEY